mmetsp:Transcript_56996/g.184620  ORF Transcript_56996/g.184620 Transcript_56996/m.184620 type:complete len:236 (+) Transcript_56996:205-912(+)
MLPISRHRPQFPWLPIDARRRGDGLDRRPIRQCHGDPRQGGMLREAAHAVDLAICDAMLAKLGDQRRPVHGQKGSLDDLVQRLRVLTPGNVAGKSLVSGQLRTAQNTLTQGRELALVLDGNQHRITRRLISSIRLNGRVPQAMSDSRTFAVCLIMKERHGHPVRQRAEQRGVDRASPTGEFHVQQRLEHRGVAEHATRNVRDGDAHARGPVGLARERGEPALGLHEHVVGLHVPI